MGNGDWVAFTQEAPHRRLTDKDFASAKYHIAYEVQQSPAMLEQKQDIKELQSEVKELGNKITAIEAFREGENRGFKKWQSITRNWILFGGVIASLVFSIGSLTLGIYNSVNSAS